MLCIHIILTCFNIKGCFKHFNSTPNPKFTLAHKTDCFHIQNNLVHMDVLCSYVSLDKCPPPHSVVENI